MILTAEIDKKIQGILTTLCLARKKFSRIDGNEWAGAFAFNAFFSLFPLIVLSVTIASAFIDRPHAGAEVIAYVESYVPISGDMQSYIFTTVAGVVKAPGKTGLIAFLMLVWASMQFFSSLICATNRAWGNMVNSLWRLPLKSLVFLVAMVCAVLIGIVAPAFIKIAETRLFPANVFGSGIYTLGSYLIPSTVIFLGLSLFYQLAPRRRTRFTEIWPAALGATVILKAAESLFIVYVKNFAGLSAGYGAFGGIMALLLWIYYSGYIFIFGACFCATQAQMRIVPIKKEPL
jgi:YihY family inner membrane protein